MHVAFLNLPSPGHVYPTLGIVAELADRGHQVSYATTERMLASVADAGARPVRMDLGLREGARSTAATPQHMDLTSLKRVQLTLDWARRAIPELEEQFADDRPDVVVHDGITPGWYGRVLATRWQVPAVETWPTFVWPGHWALTHPRLLRHAGRVRRELRDLDADATLRSVLDGKREALRLVLLPRAFQAGGKNFDDSFRFIGPCFGTRDFQGAWTPPEKGQRLVLVTMSEAVSNWPQFFRICIDAFADLPWRFVISPGRHKVDELGLGSIPGNIELRADVPVTQVLQHADLYINSAGMGTVMESLAFGVPVLAIPLGFERPVTARRLQKLGLGLSLDPGHVTAKSLRQMAEALVGDEKVRGNLGQMQAQIRAAGGPKAAADAIEQRTALRMVAR